MGKELVLAIALGAFLGFGLTGSFFGLKNALNTKIVPQIYSPTAAPTPSPLPTEKNPVKSQKTAPTSQPLVGGIATEGNHNTFVINEPTNYAILNTTDATITGISSPNSLVTANNKTQVFQTSSDTTGKFSLKVKLDSGMNEIVLTSLSPTDDTYQQTLYVTYTNVKI